MGYINNDAITVSAVLTKYGRLKLSRGQGLGISKYAFYDDEVDYNLYNTANDNGSEYFDEAITNLPLLEPVPDHNVQLRFPLKTLDDTVFSLPTILVTSPTITVINAQHRPVLAPQTLGWSGNTESYRFEISDTNIINAVGIDTVATEDISGTTGGFQTQNATAIHASGLEISGVHDTTTSKTAFIKIYGLSSDAYTDVTVIVSKATN
jgi:hypothetical protein